MSARAERAQPPEIADERTALVGRIEETPRHCGHLHLLREHRDGVIGE